MPLHPFTPHEPSDLPDLPSWWVTPRHLAGDDAALADHVTAHLSSAGWTSLTLVRGRREPVDSDDPYAPRPVVRSTVLHISPDALRWAQWVLADEPILLGDLPVAWTVSARADADGLAQWTAYFTTGVPPEVVADFLLALDARPDPAYGYTSPYAVFEALAGRGWVRDIDDPGVVSSPLLAASMALAPLPEHLQDGDPFVLAPEEQPIGWLAWCEPRIGWDFLWTVGFSASTPHDLVAAFAASLTSPDPVLRHTLPQVSEGQLSLRPAI